MSVPKTTTARFEGFSDPTFTPVPDELFDELLATLSGAEVKVLLYIIRRTYGFKKRSDRVSKSQLESGIQRADGTVVDHGTGLSRRAIRLAVDSLVARDVLIKHTHQSAEKGFEATEYSLHRRPEKALERGHIHDADPGVLSTQGLGREVPKPLGRGVPIQETVKQERTRQEAGFDLSNLRKGSLTALTVERVEESAESTPAPAVRPNPKRFGDALPQRAGTRTPVARPVRANAQLEQTTAAAPERHSDNGAAATARYSHERQVILVYLRDFAGEFHDRAPLKSSVTRALHLFERSGLALDAFVGKLYEARALTKERAAAIGYQGREAPQRGVAALRNKTPYFFALLEDVLGLRAAAEGEGTREETPPTTETASASPLGASQQPSRRRQTTSHSTATLEKDQTETVPTGALPATADPAAIWQATLAELEQTVTRPIFETYLRDTGDAVRASGRLIVTVPSDFAVEWLTTKLYPVVSQAVARVVGEPVSLAFVVAPARPATRRGRKAPSTPPPVPEPAS